MAREAGGSKIDRQVGSQLVACSLAHREGQLVHLVRQRFSPVFDLCYELRFCAGGCNADTGAKQRYRCE